MSVQDLRPSPQPISEFYLEKIYNRLDDASPSYISHPNTATKPPAFTPPRYVVWVNALWFLSFTISLSYAMLAMMLHQWARRYQRVTQHIRSSPHKRARVRAFFSDAIDGLHVLWVIEGVRAMIHLSMFLFFAGLLIYLFNICHAVFAAVIWWVAFSTVGYASFTLLPLFRPNSPYYAPLSSILMSLYACISYALFHILSSPVFNRLGFDAAVERFRKSRDHYRKLFFEDIRKIAEETALQQSSVIDVHVLESMFDALGEDRAQEEFFEAIPGFFDSELVHVFKEDLSDEFRNKFSRALNTFLDRTFSFNSITESVRGGRLVICLNAAHAVLGSEDVLQILWDILSRRWPELFQSVETGNALRRWSEGIDDRFTPDVRRIVAQIVVGVRERDERWISLVKTEYGIPGHVLRDYIGHGDSVLLSILLHMTREAFRTGSWTPWILSSLSEFNIRDTFPELQQAFCALWNDIVRDAWSEVGPTNNPVRILRDLRHAYIALHQGTAAALTAFSASTPHFHPVLRQPQSYQFCTVASHRQRLPIYTPMIGSLNIPSLTQLDQSSAVSPLRPSLTESGHTTDGGTVSAQAEGANVIVETSSSMDRTPDSNHTQGSTSPPITSNSEHIAHATSIAGPSVSESVAALISWDPAFLVPGEVLHGPDQSAPSVAKIASTSLVRPDEPAPQIHTSESGKTAEAPVARSLILQHPDPVPATVTPSTGTDQPSCFMPDPGDNLDALKVTISSATLSHPLEGIKQQETVASLAAPDISEILSTVKSIPWSTPTFVISDSPSSPIPSSALSSGMTTLEPPFVESAPTQPDLIPHTFRSPSSSLATASSHIYPQVAPAFDAKVTPSIGTPSPHGKKVLLHLTQTAPPAHNTVVATSQPEDQIHQNLDKL